MGCRDRTDGERQTEKYKQILKQSLPPVLSEKDFYPPQDNRCWQSGVDDISGGDNFAEYAESFFKMCECEEYLD